VGYIRAGRMAWQRRLTCLSEPDQKESIDA
jgi:hypothetical protein